MADTHYIVDRERFRTQLLTLPINDWLFHPGGGASCDTTAILSVAFSVARLGGFPPNWTVLNLVVWVNIDLGEWTKFGLVFGQFGGFQNI